MSIMEHVYEEIVSPIKMMKIEDNMCSMQSDNTHPQSSSTPKANHSGPSRCSSGTEDSYPGSCSSQQSGGRPFGVQLLNKNQPLVPKSKTKPLKVLQNQGIHFFIIILYHGKMPERNTPILMAIKWINKKCRLVENSFRTD